MVRVTIDMVPFGDDAKARTIGVLQLARREVFANPCDYDAHLVVFEKADGTAAGYHAVVREHFYEEGVYALIRRAMEEIQRAPLELRRPPRSSSPQTAEPSEP